MRCAIERKAFEAAKLAIQPPPDPDNYDPLRDMEYEGYLRAEANGGMLRLRCQYGQTEVAARIERLGAFFVETREFCRATRHLLSLEDCGDEIVFDVNKRRIRVNTLNFLIGDDWAFFEDPTAAPQAWEPPPPPPEEQFHDDEAAIADESIEAIDD